MGWDTQRLDYWGEHYKRWQTSGLTQPSYCAEQAISLSAFTRWNKRIRSIARAQEVVQRDDVKAGQAITLVPVRLTPDTCNAPLELQNGSRWQLQIPAAISAHWLAEFLNKLS